MGEYATRKADGVKIKIGTCEDMYYLRYEDRAKVAPLPGSLDPAQELNLRFRLPYPDEDDILPGDYAQYDRGQRLYKQDEGDRYPIDWSSPELADQTGGVQLSHPSGLLLWVPCHHGERLPETGPEIKAAWNGKSHSYELAFIKNTPKGIVPVIKCRHCNSLWRVDWSDIADYIPSPLKERLSVYFDKTGEQS